VAGTGLANAQGTMKNESGAGAQPTQHSQSTGGAAERSGSMGRESTHSMSRESTQEKGTVGQAGGSSTMKSGTSAEEKASGATKEEHSGREMNKNATEEKSGATKGQRTEEHAQGREDKSKSMSEETSKSGAKDSKDMKAEGREGRDNNMKAEGNKSGTSTNNAENRPGNANGTNTNAAEGRTGTSNTTVGQAGAGAKLSTEQRTQITSVIREEHVRPVTNVNFSISVGTRIPREGIELHALPSRVVTIYPEWRTYKYVLVKDEIVVINPDTYEIVAVLNT
jgi:hypothetical protein